MNRKIRLALWSTLITVVGVAVIFLLLLRNWQQSPKVGGNFTLPGVNGPVQLSDFRGKAVVLYFGYTACPDVCPTSLAKLGAVMKELNAKQREAIVTIFVSVDYRSDTPVKVDQYAKFFIANSVGLVGTKAETDQVTSVFRTMYRVEESAETALGYTVLHGTNFYLIDRSGDVAQTLPLETTTAELKRGLLALIN